MNDAIQVVMTDIIAAVIFLCLGLVRVDVLKASPAMVRTDGLPGCALSRRCRRLDPRLVTIVAHVNAVGRVNHLSCRPQKILCRIVQ